MKQSMKKTIKSQQSQSVQESFRYVLLYTVTFLFVSIGVFFAFFYKNRSFAWTTDAVSQYIPKAYYFVTETKAFLKSLLEGELQFQMYDFRLGFGDAVPLHLEPVYFLYLIFPERYIEYAYGLLILFRFYLAGLSMSVFLKSWNRGKYEMLLGSMVYVFSGYGLYGGMRHSHFIIPMIILPLLLLAVDEICMNRRWHLCTIFVTISIWCGYYFTYMNTILMGVYFLIRFFGTKEIRTVKNFFLKGFTIAGAYLLGLGIGNITFFNTFAAYLHSSRTTKETALNLWSYSDGWLTAFYQCFITAEEPVGSWLLLGFIPLCYIYVLILFIKKGHLQLKAAFGIGTLFCMVPVFGYVFSGFSTINNRWCYGYAFVIATITAFLAKEMFSLTKKELLTIGAGISPYLFMGILPKLLGKSYEKTLLLPGVLLIITFIIVVLINRFDKIKANQKLCGVLVAGLVVVSLWISGVERFTVMISEFTGRGKVMSKITDTPLKVYDEIEDDSFYRIYATDSYSDVQGCSMVYDYNGMVQYSSTLNGTIVDFYRDFGLTSWSLVRIRGYDGRDYLNTLASMKYRIYGDDETVDISPDYSLYKEVEKGSHTYRIYENENVLPIGYTYDSYLTQEDLENIDVVHRQEVVLQGAILDTEVSLNKLTNPSITGSVIPITEKESSGATYSDSNIKVTKKKGTVTFSFDGKADSETYLVVDGLRMNNSKKVWFTFDTETNSFRYCYHGDKNTYNTDQDVYIFNLGYSKEGIKECSISFNQKCTISYDNIYVYCQETEALSDYVAKLGNECLENIELTANTVSGDIAVQEEKLLALSIPYQNGWTAYVDGEKTELLKCNLMYSAVMLSPGKHHIELRFVLPGVQISILVTVVSAAIFIVLLVICRHRRKQKELELPN